MISSVMMDFTENDKELRRKAIWVNSETKERFDCLASGLNLNHDRVVWAMLSLVDQHDESFRQIVIHILTEGAFKTADEVD